jgi:hypothetical protein
MLIHKKYQLEQACSRDIYSRPIYCTPYLRRLGDGRAHVIATDNYIAARVRVSAEADSEGWVPIPALKHARRESPSKVCEIACRNGTATAYGASFERPEHESSYPCSELDTYFDGARGGEPTIEVALNAKSLYRLSQALGNEEVRLRIRGPVQAIYVQPLGDQDAEGLIMPIRLKV